MQPAVRTMRETGFSRGESRRGMFFSFEALEGPCIDRYGFEDKSPFSGDLFFIAWEDRRSHRRRL